MAHTKRTARKSTGGKAPKKAQLTPKNKPKGAPKTTTKGAPKNTPKGAPKTKTKGAPKFGHPSTGKFQDSTVFFVTELIFNFSIFLFLFSIVF